MTKEDLHNQREQDTWIKKILNAALGGFDAADASLYNSNPYCEFGKDFIVFTRGKNLWKLSIKEKKPRKKKSHGTK